MYSFAFRIFTRLAIVALLFFPPKPADAQTQAVSIPDDSLRVAVERSLGKARGAAITRAEMRRLTRVSYGSRGISDLTGLEHATNLTRLRLDGNRISDISVLSGLTRLTELDLDNNSISNIDSLSTLTNLLGLDIRNNRISDIEPLVNNAGLDGRPFGEFINLTGNPLSAESRNTHVPALQARGVNANYWPVIILTLSPSTIDESGSANRATVTATRYGEGNVLSKPPATEVFTVSATAVAPAMADDFTLSTNALLTFESSSWNSMGTVTITAVNDEIQGSDKRVTVSATKTSGTAYVTPPLAVTLTIDEDDETTPTVTLVLSPASISENGGISTVTAMLDHASGAATTVTVSAMADPPAMPNDFTLSSADTLIIAAGQTTSTGTFTITAVNNAVSAPDKTITVSATATNSIGVNAPSNATLTIFDDETPTATLAVADASISENGGSTTVTATLSPTSSTPTTIVVRPLADAYAVGADSTIVIAAGQTENTLDNVTITAVDNAQDAPDRDITVSGVARNNQGVNRLIDAALTLTDDDAAPTVTLALSPASISEYDGVSTVLATLDHASSEATTVTVSAMADPPAMSSDFTLSSANTLTIAAGETTSTGAVTITAVDNTVSAADKMITVSATATNSQGISNPSDVTLTIADDEGPISIPDDSLRVALERTLGKARGAAISRAEMRTLTSISYSSRGISDLTGLEYATNLTSLIVDNNSIEDISALSDLTGLTRLGIDNNSIEDISVLSGLTRLTRLELDNNGIEDISALSGLTGLTELDLDDNSISDLSALSTLTNLIGLDIRNNRVSNIEPLVNNAGLDGRPFGEFINLTGNPLSAESRNTHVPALQARGVNASISPAITLTLSPSTIDEGGATTITATLDQPVLRTMAITVSATAVAPATADDFSLSSNATLTFTGGGSGNKYSTGTVTLTAANDEIHSGSDKRVIVSATGAGSTYITLPLDVTLAIADDETTPTVTLVLSPASISENGGISTVTATLDHASGAATTITGSAMEGHLLRRNFTLIIAAGQTTSTSPVAITAVDNAVSAPNKTITLSATATNSIGVNNPPNVTLTIVDDETPTATLAVADTSISENGGSTTVTATLSQTSGAATTIVVRPLADAYAVGADSTIVIAAGQTENTLDTVVITAVDNTRDEADRDITVSGVARNSQGVSRLIGAALTLTDDDAAPTVTLVLSPASISEYGGVSTVLATLDHASSEATTVTVSAVEVPPAMSSDFTLSSANTLTIAAGETTSTGAVTITAVDNMVSAADKMITVSATATNSRGINNPSDVTLTIADDEATVTIPDDSLRVVIERALGKARGAAISRAEMRTLTRIPYTSRRIGDLTGLEHATNLTSLHFGDNLISDVSPLSALDSLTTLNLRNNRISDISALSGLTGLTELDLGDNRISDISALSTLTGLTELNLHANRISDIEPLVNNTGLDGRPRGEGISLTGNPLSAESRNAHVPALRARGVNASYWPVIILTLSPSTINERGSTNQTTVTAVRKELVGNSELLVSPHTGTDVVTVSATAVAPATANDFTVSTNATLTFRAIGIGEIATDRGQSAGTVTITAVDDEDHNLDKRVIVSGTVASEVGSVTPPLDLILTIDNDDATRQVTLVLTPSTIGESGATNRTTVTATLNRTSTAATTITVSAVEVSPAVSSDFSLSSANTLTIAAGQTTSAGTVTITAVDNLINAPPKMITVSATVQNSQGVSTPAAVTLTITDDDAPTVTLSLSPSAIDEGGSSNRTTVTATLNRTSTAATTVTVSASPGANAMASDFSLSSANTLTIAAGQTTSTGTVTITAVDNMVSAADKTIAVSATAANSMGVNAPSDVALTIVDDDAAVTISDANLRAVIEDSLGKSRGATISRAEMRTLTRFTHDPARRLASYESLRITDLTGLEFATGLTDLDLDNNNISDLSPLRNLTALTVLSLNNNRRVSDLSPLWNLSLQSLSLANNGLAAPIQSLRNLTGLTVLSLNENDLTDISLLSSLTRLVRLYLYRNDISDLSPLRNLDNLTDLILASNDISDISPLFEIRDLSSVHLTGNPLSAESRNTHIPTLESRSVGVTISPEVTLALSSSTISEGSSGNVTTVTATMDISYGHLGTTITVSTGLIEGTAEIATPRPSDFTLSSNRVLTIADRATTSTGLVTITATDDQISEFSEKLVVSGAIHSDILGARSSIILAITPPVAVPLTILDNDKPGVLLEMAPTSISENGGISKVTATLTRASSAATTVSLRVQPSGIASEMDYTLSGNRSLTIAAGETTSTDTLTITAVDNVFNDRGKGVTVYGTATSSQDVTQPVAVNLVFLNDDPARLALSLTPETIDESGANNRAIITATLDNSLFYATTITVSATAVPPALQDDFTLSSNAVMTIMAGETTSTDTVRIAAVDNATDAPDKTITVSATAQSRHSQGVSASPKSLTIRDDDAAPTVTLAVADTSISESGGSTNVTATLSHASSTITTITVRPVADAYTVGADSTIVIAAGSTADASDVVAITAVDNARDEANRDATVSGVARNDQGVGNVTGASLTLTDDDATPTVTLSLSPASISENGGISTVTATLDLASSANTAVTISANPGANAVATDFSLSSAKTLTIAAGATTSTGTVTITAVDNAVNTPNKTVTVSGTATNSHGITNPSSVALTITDDETPQVTLVLSPAAIDESGSPNETTVTATLNLMSTAATTITVSAAAVLPAVPDDFTLSNNKLLTIAANATTSTGTVTITAEDNATDAPNKTVTVSATAQSSQDVSAPSSVTLTIRDDDAAPTVTLAVADASISENGGSTNVTATLSRASSAITTITVRPVADAYTVGADSTIVIAAGQTENAADVVAITAVDNAQDEANRDATISGVARNDQGVGTVTGASLTLTDDDDEPTVTLALDDASISESGGSTTVTATLSRASSAITTITVRPVADAYTVGADSTIVIAAGSTADASDVVVITAVGNTRDEANRAITVSGVARNAQGVGNVTGASLTLTDDDDEPTISISDPSVAEGASGATATLTFAVSLSAASNREVTVDYAETATGRTATQDADYTALTPGTLTFAPSDTSKSIAISVIGDATDEPDEVVKVELSSPNNATFSGGGMTLTGTGTITDDDATPTVTLSLSPATIDESGSSNQTTVTATLDHASSAITTVTVSANPGTNTLATDFTLSSADTLLIAAGATTSTGLVTITAVDNAVNAPNKTVTVSGSATNSHGITNPSSVTLTIRDDEGPPLVTLALSASTIDESGSSNQTTVTATLNRASSAITTVTVSASPGANTLATDFTLSSADTLLIAAGATTSTGLVTITAVDNAINAPNKTVTVSGTAANSHGITNPSDVTLTITDDETPQVTLVLSPATIDESGSPNETTVTATLNLMSTAATTITVSAAAVLPAVPDDFTLSNNKLLTIAANATTSTGTVTITAEDNATDAPNKTVTVSATAQSSQDVSAPSGVILTIRDDDAAPTVTLAVADASISENGGSTNVTATLSRASSAITTITVRPVADAYTVGADSTIVIAAGQTENASDVVAITAVDNAQDEANRDATVSGVARNAQGVGTVTGAALTLTDDDAAPTVTLALTDASISESGGSTTVTATLSRASSAITTITVRPVADAYTVGADSTIVIAAGSTADASDVVVITAVGNTRDEANRAITVSGVARNDQGVGNVTGASLTLTDDDDEPTLSISDPSVAEGASGATATLTFAVSLSAASNREVTVDYAETATGRTATQDADYTALTAGTLTFAPSDTSKSIAISVIGDATDEPDEVVKVELSSPNNATFSGGGMTLTGTGTITDDDATPTVTLALSASTIDESGSSNRTTVTATLDHASSEITTVTVSANPGTNTLATDFTLSSADTLLIAAGATTSTGLVTITAVDNAVNAPNKTVTVSGSATNSHGITNPSDVALTIRDDEGPPLVTLALSASTIDESGSSNQTTVTATLNRASSAITTVTVSANPGANTLATDFTLSSADTLLIAAGATTSTGLVTITAVDNAINAPNKTVTVSGAATNSHGITNPSDVTLTIRDDEGPPLVTLVLSASTIDESGSSNRTTVTATLNRASSAITTVTISANPGANAVMGDFTLSSADTLLIAANATTSTGLVTIAAVDNATDAPNKTVTVSGSAANSQGITNPLNVTLTIADDDATPTVTLSLSSASISENGGMSTVTATLNRASSAITTVTISADPGANAAVGDFTLSSADTLLIAAGATTSTGLFTITAADDATDAPNKTVTVSGSAANSHGITNPSDVTLTIADDDATPTVTLVLSPASISENGGISTVTATLNRASSAITTVTVSANPGANAAMGDFTPSSATTLTIAAGSTTSTGAVTITAVDNAVTALPKAVTVSGTANNSHGATNPSNVTLTITDDETPQVTLALSASTIDESGASNRTTITATLDLASSAVTTVTVSAAPGENARAGDFALSSNKVLLIATGSTTSTGRVTITAVDNATDAPNKTVTVSATAQNSQGVGNPPDATLTIADDDAAPTVTLALSPASISENGGVSTVLATLGHASSAVTTVTVSAAPGANAVAGDFALSDNKVLLIAAGSTTSTGTVTIAAVSNVADDPNKTVTVSATAQNGQGVTAPLDVTLTITDDVLPDDKDDPVPPEDMTPTFTDAVDFQRYRQDTPITPLTFPAVNDGDGALTYSMTPPPGLTYTPPSEGDTHAGVLSGTPTEPRGKTIYTLTATDEDGDEASVSFFIVVMADRMPSFGDTLIAASYVQNREIEALTLPRATGGDSALTYALTPDLPEVLRFDAKTRVLSGRPLEAMAETTYALTATDRDGDEAILTFTLEVIADPMPTFGDATLAAQVYVQHREIDPLTLPQATGGDEPLTYALTPDLPEGLSFDAETLMLSGTPIKAMDAMTYTLTATDSNGDAAHLMFTLEIPDLMPTFGDTTIAAQSYLVNQQIESLMLPQATSGDGMLAYILLPYLPDGLTFDHETRVLSGRPTEAIAETTYTLSALDADGDVASLTFTLDVQMPSSDFDGDGNVNFVDFILFVGKYGSRLGQERYDPRCDLNGDGAVDFDDFLIFEVRFGATG